MQVRVQLPSEVGALWGGIGVPDPNTVCTFLEYNFYLHTFILCCHTGIKNGSYCANTCKVSHQNKAFKVFNVKMRNLKKKELVIKLFTFFC